MSTNYHTPYPTNMEATSTNANAPLGQLDQAITNLSTTITDLQDNSLVKIFTRDPVTSDKYNDHAIWKNSSTNEFFRLANPGTTGDAYWVSLNGSHRTVYIEAPEDNDRIPLVYFANRGSITSVRAVVTGTSPSCVVELVATTKPGGGGTDLQMTTPSTVSIDANATKLPFPGNVANMEIAFGLWLVAKISSVGENTTGVGLYLHTVERYSIH